MQRFTVAMSLSEAEGRGWEWRVWALHHQVEAGIARTRGLAWAAMWAMASEWEREDARKQEVSRERAV